MDYTSATVQAPKLLEELSGAPRTRGGSPAVLAALLIRLLHLCCTGPCQRGWKVADGTQSGSAAGQCGVSFKRRRGQLPCDVDGASVQGHQGEAC